jgi:1-acyl-sn-glycerol-3-phosphate acyltransferase
LSRAALGPASRRLWQWLQTYAYGLYVWLLVVLVVPGVWVAVATLPRRQWRRGLVAATIRFMLRLFGVPVSVRGLEHLPAEGPYVLAANHGSYLDGMLLTGFVPGTYRYVVAARFQRIGFTRVLLGRLGSLWVDRWDPSRAVADARRFTAALAEGIALLVFPEGGFDRAPGVKPFKMGAFVSAAQTGTPVVPVAIAGAREILRGEDRIPRRGAVTIRVFAPIHPQGSDWQAAIALRDAVRARIQPACAEPDLLR